MPRTKRLLAWVVVLGLGTWSFSHSSAGRSLAAAAGWGGQDAPSGDGYVFLSETASGPVRWSSCRAIEVVVNDQRRPAGAEDAVADGLAEVAAASGLTITIVGASDELPSDDRPVEQTASGAGWEPVLVAWTTPADDPGLAGDTIGLGGGASVMMDGMPRYVSGQISLDAPQVAEVLEQPGGAAAAKAVVMHEMAHVLGLGHVDDPSQVMAESTSVSELAEGDLAGLEVAGDGPCL